MVKYAIPFYLPVFLDRILIFPLLLLRRLWFGYAFRRIKLANCAQYAIVEPGDYAELCKYTWWSDYSYGSYRAIRFVGKDRGHTALQMHRQIMSMINPKFETLNPKQIQNSNVRNSKERLVIDHINRNSLDNRRANLRIATGLQNARNRVKINKKCSSIYKGVCWSKHHKKWAVQINDRKTSIHLGYFDDEIEAAKVYDAAAKKYHKEFACLNFPPVDKRGLKNLFKYWLHRRERRE